MPIYAYKCGACGHRRDVLQKLSDPVLVECPACGAPALAKQLTAAGFQLKGSGWYVTDFRNGPSATKKPDDGKAGATADTAADKSGEQSAAKPADAAATAPAAVPAASPDG
jgi:putative FmdB family regulatory protein